MTALYMPVYRDNKTNVRPVDRSELAMLSERSVSSRDELLRVNLEGLFSACQRHIPEGHIQSGAWRSTTKPQCRIIHHALYQSIMTIPPITPYGSHWLRDQGDLSRKHHDDAPS